MKKLTTIKTHRFVLDVKTSATRKSAKYAVLSSFACRKPDNCAFYLKDRRA